MIGLRSRWVSVLLLLAGQMFSGAQTSPQRIVSLAPNITEMVYRLGLQDRLVGRTAFCSYPPGVERLPSVGGYLDPDFEQMVRLEPDWVLLLPNPEMERKLHHLGLTTLTLPNETVEEILQGLLKLGEVFHVTERARQVVQGIRDTLQWIRRQCRGKRPVRAVLVVGRTPGTLQRIYVAGGETYLSQLWNMSGGQNIFQNIPLRYFETSWEDLIKADPQAILEFRGQPLEAAEMARVRREWQALNLLTAVRKQHLFLLSDRMFLIPGPRIARIAMQFYQMAEQIRGNNGD